MGLGRLIFILYKDLNPYQEGFCSRRVYLHTLDVLCRSSSSKKKMSQAKIKIFGCRGLGRKREMPQNTFQMSLLAQQTPIPEAIPIAWGTCVAVCSPWHRFQQVSGSPLSCFFVFFFLFLAHFCCFSHPVFFPLPAWTGSGS